MKIRLIYFTGAIALSITLASCGYRPPSRLEAAKVCPTYESAFTQQKGTFTDPRDNKTYETVEIGTQTWMAENLNYNTNGSKCYGEGGQVEKYNERGDNIGFTKLSPAEIQANCDKYGRLYYLATMNVCPNGWHLPSTKEWETLTNFVDTNEVTKLKSSNGWDICNGSDNYGFAALPGGFGLICDKVPEKLCFGRVGEIGSWWTSTRLSIPDINRVYHMGYIDKSMGYIYSYSKMISHFSDEKNLLSVRCVKDSVEIQKSGGESSAALTGSGYYCRIDNAAYPNGYYCQDISSTIKAYQQQIQAYQQAAQQYPRNAQEYQQAVQTLQQYITNPSLICSKSGTFTQSCQAPQQLPQKTAVTQQEAIQAYQAAAQKMQATQREALQEYQATVQKNPAAAQEAALKYQKALQEAQRELQEAAKKYQETMQNKR